MSTETVIEHDDDVEEIELVVEDGHFSDEEIETLRVLVEALPSDVDLLDIAAAHGRLVQARRGRQEQQPRQDLVSELDLIRELETTGAVPADATAAEAEFLRGVLDYANAMVRVVRLQGAHARLRARVGAAQEARAKLLAAGMTDEARKVEKSLAAAKRRLREPVVPPGVERELGGLEARAQMLADRLVARSGDDPERDAVMSQARNRVRDAAPERRGAGRKRWPRRRARP